MPANNVDAVAVTCSPLWTWEGGSKTADALGVYGTLGAGSAANVPGARWKPTAWTDAAGNFWLLGGVGAGATGIQGNLDDLWFYTPSSGQWTWAGGPKTINVAGAYGKQGVGSTLNMPGSRDSAESWADSEGNLWLFGGEGYDSTGGFVTLNDLWKYTPSNGEWTWVAGSSTGNAIGVYGTLGIGSTANTPGARVDAVSWMDQEGNLWLFGGFGEGLQLNDLWKFTPSNREWTWVGGSNTTSDPGFYGTLGVGSTANRPPARSTAMAWTDRDGNFWLFGGMIASLSGLMSDYNDLWKYTPSNNEWTWMSGSNTPDASGKYGTLGNRSTSNAPGARIGGLSWVDGTGDLWLFGGSGYDSSGQDLALNDLWQFTPSNRTWTWMGGSKTVMASGVYGTLGQGTTANVPGARSGAASWSDTMGHFWLFGGVGNDSDGKYATLNDLWRY